MKPKSGITREELIKWGGAEVFNQALAIVNSGDVIEAEYDDDKLEIRGKIEQPSGWAMSVTLKLERNGMVRSLCPCRTNQQYHQICQHVVALGIAIMAMEMDDEEEAHDDVKNDEFGDSDQSSLNTKNFIEVPMKPRMAAFVSGSRASLSIEIDARYGEIEIPACSIQAPHTVWIEDSDDPLVRKTRSMSAEKAAVKEVEKWGFEPGYREGDLKFYITDQHKVLNFLGAGLPALRRLGWVIDLSERLMDVTDKMPSVVPVVTIKDAPNGAFDVQYQFDAMGHDISPVEIQAAINRNDGFIMKDGNVVLVDTAAISTMHDVFRDCATTQGGAPAGWFRVAAVHAPYVKASLEQLDCELEDEEAFEWRERAVALGRERGDAKFEPISLGSLDKILRPYQKQGVYWMRFLENSGLSGLLADEMGLGKTLQTLTWLSLPRSEGQGTRVKGQGPRVKGLGARVEGQGARDKGQGARVEGRGLRVEGLGARGVLNPSPLALGPSPSLIVCPTSLVRNWEAEAKKFIPSMKVLVVSGPDRAQVFNQMEKYHLVITSYALLQRDFEDAYMGRDFDVVVLDEAQHIKNRQTKNARAVKMLHSNRRLVLTGTPVENSVADVWSIFDFLMPGYLGDYETFKLSYEMPVQDGGSAGEEALSRLKRKLHPFILRRLKKTVAKDLPDKIIKVSYCPISDEAQSEYLALLQKTRSEVGDMVRERGFNASKFEILARLMKLRQIASKGKVDAFLEQLEDAIAGGHRILVFSQFVKMLQLIAALLQSKGINFCYLDGSTKDRLGECNRFNMDRSIPVFLISLMAGGTGLNLTGADMVIHYDPWWNPAVEDQATDRAHRIGQKKNVYVMKMIASNTIEEKVLELQRRKQAIISATVSTTDAAVMEKLTADDIANLLS